MEMEDQSPQGNSPRECLIRKKLEFGLAVFLSQILSTEGFLPLIGFVSFPIFEWVFLHILT